MTERKADKTDRKLHELFQAPKNIIVTMSLYPHISSKGIEAGCYIYIPDCCPLFLEGQSPVVQTQFIGIHDCLCITLRKPPNVTTLPDITKQLPDAGTLGSVVWMGTIRGWPSSSGRGLRFYIPKFIWETISPPIGRIVRTRGIVHPVKSGKGMFEYWLLTIPAVQYKHLVPLYLQE